MDIENYIPASAPTRREVLPLFAAAVGCLSGPTPSLAEEKPDVDLALVLAVDASGSVNQRRFELQKQGYVTAFHDPRILKAIQSGVHGKIAAAMYQWTGPMMQALSARWTVITDSNSIRAFATAIDSAPRRLFGGGTSISGAIDYGAYLLAAAPCTAGRQVIDISGDGANNRGRPSADARDEAIRSGVVINGLPILELERDLDEFYRRNVIGGPNAFLVVARSFDEFADAIMKKLITEIAGVATASPQLRPG